MTKVFGLDRALTHHVRGKIGRSCGFGRTRFAYNRMGFYSPYVGVYSTYPTKNGRMTRLKKYHRPPLFNTVPAIMTRIHFAQAVGHWRMLTEQERQNYNKKAKRYKLTGYNLYISRYLKNEV